MTFNCKEMVLQTWIKKILEKKIVAYQKKPGFYKEVNI